MYLVDETGAQNDDVLNILSPSCLWSLLSEQERSADLLISLCKFIEIIRMFQGIFQLDEGNGIYGI